MRERSNENIMRLERERERERERLIDAHSAPGCSWDLIEHQRYWEPRALGLLDRRRGSRTPLAVGSPLRLAGSISKPKTLHMKVRRIKTGIKDH